MFSKRKGQITAILMLLSVSSQPMISHASEPAAPAAVIETHSAPIAENTIVSSLKDYSFEAFRHDAKSKLSETQRWVKDKTQLHDYENPIKTLETKIDRLQDQVTPAGRSIKASFKTKVLGNNLIQKGDRNFSVYGFMLMLAFGLVFLLMSLSGPASRLGGRH